MCLCTLIMELNGKIIHPSMATLSNRSEWQKVNEEQIESKRESEGEKIKSENNLPANVLFEEAPSQWSDVLDLCMYS